MTPLSSNASAGKPLVPSAPMTSLPDLVMPLHIFDGGFSPPREPSQHSPLYSHRFSAPRTPDHPPVRKRLLSTLDEQENNVPPESANKRLRRDLFGKDEKSSSLLGSLGDAKETSSFSAIKSPFREAMLYTTGQSPILYSTVKRPAVCKHRVVKTQHEEVFRKPHVLQEDSSHLNIISVGGPSIAAGFGNAVYLIRHDGDDQTPIELPGSTYATSVKWSKSTVQPYLAVGATDAVLILDPEHGLVDYFDDPVGIVSAMECQDGNNIVTASRSGIQRFDIRCDYNNRIITTFDPGFGRENPVTRLLFDDNILAAAGGNCVRLWDQRYDIIKNGPMLELQHDNVRGLEFCPSRRNVLATGGADGIHFWDVASGDLRSTIPTLLPVTGLTWSPYQNELMTSCGEIMTLWSVAPQVHRLAEWSLGKESGRIFTLDRYTNSPRVVSLHKNGCLAAWNPFGAPPIYREAPLQTPKLRPIDLR